MADREKSTPPLPRQVRESLLALNSVIASSQQVLFAIMRGLPAPPPGEEPPAWFSDLRRVEYLFQGMARLLSRYELHGGSKAPIEQLERDLDALIEGMQRDDAS